MTETSHDLPEVHPAYERASASPREETGAPWRLNLFLLYALLLVIGTAAKDPDLVVPTLIVELFYVGIWKCFWRHEELTIVSTRAPD